jgi:hypothetical protein
MTQELSHFIAGFSLFVTGLFLMRKELNSRARFLIRFTRISDISKGKASRRFFLLIFLIFQVPSRVCSYLSQLCARGPQNLHSWQHLALLSNIAYLIPLGMLFIPIPEEFSICVGIFGALRLIISSPNKKLIISFMFSVSLMLFGVYLIQNFASPIDTPISQNIPMSWLLLSIIAVISSSLFSSPLLFYFITFAGLYENLITFFDAYSLIIGATLGSAIFTLKKLPIKSIFNKHFKLSVALLFLIFSYVIVGIIFSLENLWVINTIISSIICALALIILSPCARPSHFFLHRHIQFRLMVILLLTIFYDMAASLPAIFSLPSALGIAHIIPAALFFIFPNLLTSSSLKISKEGQIPLLKVIDSETLFFLKKLRYYFLKQKQLPNYSHALFSKFEKRILEYEHFLKTLLSSKELKNSDKKGILLKHSLAKEISMLFYHLSPFVYWIKKHKGFLPPTFVSNLWESSEILLETITTTFENPSKEEIETCLKITSQQKALLNPLALKYLNEDSCINKNSHFHEAFHLFERVCWNLHTLMHFISEESSSTTSITKE